MSKSRLQGILDRVSEKKFSESRWLLGAGVLTNYAQSFIDETMKRNAEFQTKAGVAPKIVRKSPTKCCPWCDALVGEYRYPDEVPADVYRRHDNCNCIVEYYPGDGRRQNVWSKSWAEADEETLERRRTVGLDQPNKLAEGLGAEHWGNMSDLVDASGNDTVRAAWNAAAGKVEVASKNAKSAFARGGAIHIDLAKDAAGSQARMPYDTIFHETGHAIDYMNAHRGNAAGYFLSSTYKDGAFRDMLIKEAGAWVDEKVPELKALYNAKDWGKLRELGAISKWDYNTYQTTGKWWGGSEPKYSKKAAYDAVSKELRDLGAIRGGDVSDIMEGATNAKTRGTMGHGAAYWKGRKEALPTEAFAEFTAATFSNSESLEVIKKRFPESYKLFEEMCGLIAKGGNK